MFDSEVLIILMSGISVSLFIFVLFSLLDKNRKKTEAQKESVEERYTIEPIPPMIKSLTPLISKPGKQMEKLFSKIESKNNPTFHILLSSREKLSRTIVSAGLEGGVSVDELLILSLMSALSGGVIVMGLGVAIKYSILLMFISGFIFGLIYPIMWLNSKFDQRQISIRKDLPYLLDLLTLCVEAGLDFSTALSRIVGRFDNTSLGSEFSSLLRELQMGKNRSDALRALAHRVGLIELSTVVGAIIQADELGSSVGTILRIQSEEARRRRGIRAEELAMKAPVKLLFPLIIFIFPTTFAIIFGPILIKNLPLLQQLGK